MASFWLTASGVLAKPMNEIPKIVFSKKGFDPSQASSAFAEVARATKTLFSVIRISKKSIAGPAGTIAAARRCACRTITPSETTVASAPSAGDSVAPYVHLKFS
jgi:hypothetical protein